APTRGSGRNHRRQIEQGLFRGAGIVTHHRYAPPTGRALKSSEVGHFSRAEVGNSSRAPKGNPVPRVINVDKNPVYPAAVERLKAEGFLPRRVRLRQCKYLNN